MRRKLPRRDFERLKRGLVNTRVLYGMYRRGVQTVVDILQPMCSASDLPKRVDDAVQQNTSPRKLIGSLSLKVKKSRK